MKNNPELLNERDRDFYQKVRENIAHWANREENKSYQWLRWLLMAPDLFHLLIRLAADPDVPLKEKAKLGAAAAYFLTPIDLLPELILGPTGYLDDIVLASYTLNRLVNTIDPAIIDKHWAGEMDVLVTLQNILSLADRMLGSGLFKRLKNLIK